MIDHPVLEDVSIDWGGLSATHVHPSPMSDLFLSRPLIVHGKYELPGSGRVVVRGYADGRKVEIPVQVQLPAEMHGSSAIATLWARAEIGDQLAGLAFRQMSGANANEAAVKETVTGLGIAHRVVTPYTSFVAVDRSRVVGNGAPVTVNQPVEVPEDTDAERSGAVRAQLANAVMLQKMGMGSASGGLGGNLKGSIGNLMGSQVGDAQGFGGLGLRGTGAGGGGVGYGLGAATKGAEGKMGRLSATPSSAIMSSEAVVEGSLDGELIRKVIQRNLAQVKYCYQLALQANPKLAGRIVVRFTIGANGSVRKAEIVGGTLREAVFEQCLLTRVRSWLFPSPKGGAEVVVTYPFVFKLAE
jgi:TonB family protein